MSFEAKHLLAYVCLAPSQPPSAPRVIYFIDSLSPKQLVQSPGVFCVAALTGGIALCSWARHFTFTVPLSNMGAVVQRVDNVA